MTLPNHPEKIVRDAKVLAQQELATNVYFLVVESPEIARRAKAGQFVQLRILSGAFTLRRPVGVAAVDEKKGSIAFIYRVVGKGTHAELMDSCEEYREIAMSQLSEEELAGGGAR